MISEASIDDLLQAVLQKIIKKGRPVNPTKGPNKELIGEVLQLKNPRSRISRSHGKGTIFSCLGEFLWYTSQSSDLEMIQHYIPIYGNFSDDGRTIHGAYGPRIFNMHGDINQFDNIVSTLKTKNSSRRAVIQLFSAEDLLQDFKDIPCTCTLQYLIRDGRLHAVTSMRSNDAYKGLPHDIFCFTMIQELLARELSIEPGNYTHFASSLHIYEEDFDKVQDYIHEGWHEDNLMPAMPIGSQKNNLRKLLVREEKIRNEQPAAAHTPIDESGYWDDIEVLLKVFKDSKAKKLDNSSIDQAKKRLTNNVYGYYIDRRAEVKKEPSTDRQIKMELNQSK